VIKIETLTEASEASDILEVLEVSYSKGLHPSIV
jgi:hypothetical protein